MIKNEVIILSILLNSKKSNDINKIFNLVKSDDFRHDMNKIMFKSIYNYYLNRGTIPSRNVLFDIICNDIGKDKSSIIKSYINKIINLGCEKDVMHYLNLLIEKSQRRKFLTILNDAYHKYKSKSTLDMLNYLYTGTGKIINRLTANNIREGDYLDGFSERVREYVVKKFKKNYSSLFFIPTGIEIFDEFYGGLMPQELGVVMGGTGRGKSILLLNFSVAAYLNGANVVVVTIEMPKLQYETRIDSRLTGICCRKFRLSELTKGNMKHWSDVIKDLKNKQKNVLRIIDIPENANVNVIKEKLLSLKSIIGEKYLLVIDYMSLMQPVSYNSGAYVDWQSQAIISRELKELARSLNIPIWTAVQPQRKKVKNDFLTPEDVGLSYDISKNADILMALVQTQNDTLENLVRLQCVKGREGKCQTIDLHPDFDRMSLNTGNSELKETNIENKDKEFGDNNDE